MADIVAAMPEDTPKDVPETGGVRRFLPWYRLALAGITLISILMNFYQLGQNGFGSYYPPAVRSMMDNWHNFLFASYDPGGFVTIDKPPVGFWLQVASAKIFGFTPFSILLPQALCGVLAVLLLYHLVKRHFGIVAGLLAALALALSPISILTNRNETIDSTLALTLLLGAWAVMRAAETGRLRWLLLSAVIVGVGFNIKMLEAYLVVPAFGLLYLLSAPESIWKRIGHLALAALVLLVVSLSWAVAVDLTPASQRPYVDSTQDNSEISLAFGYNGIERLLGRFGGGLFGGGTRANTPANAPSGIPGFPGNGGPTNGGNRQQATGPAGLGGLFDTGTPGPLRLFTQPLAGQIAWLLPLAISGAVALAWQRRPRFKDDRQQQSLLLWGMWLLTMGIFFSVASFFHQYYMTEMAPAIAALFGIGLVIMWKDFRSTGWRGWLLPLALLATIAEQVYILSYYPTWGQWMIPLLAVLGIVAVIALVGTRVAPLLRVSAPPMRFLLPALSIGILALFIAPTVWAALPILQSKQADTLVAGPVANDGGNFASGRNGNAASQTALIRFLLAHQGNTKFLVAVASSNEADSIILATNKPVMALGGFSGSDPILTTSQLASLIANGTVRYFLVNSFNIRQIPPQVLDRIPPQFRNGLRQGGFGQQSALTSWVTQHCTLVPSSQWQSPSTGAGGTGGFGPERAAQLYDCATTH